jgi:mitochondrial protein MBA1
MSTMNISQLIRPRLISNLFSNQTLPSFRRFASNDAQRKMGLEMVGVGTDLYIHPASKNLPSFFTSPKLRMRGIYRRALAFFQNTYMLAHFRMKSKLRPRFVEWRNLALRNYVKVNKAFVAKDLENIKGELSLWVYESLKARLSSVPSDTKFNWKLVKFLSRPKIMYIQPVILPDRPMTHVQIVYRIESRQALAKLSKGQDQVQTIERDVTDYFAYIFDAAKVPSSFVLAGSLKETPLDAPRPDPTKDITEHSMALSMKAKGDIFR